jgi:methylmalonyl-CoA/ethylmalonyl-CoA epimerase
MAIIALDHVAIAVDDLPAGIRRFCDDLGLRLAGTEDVQAAKTSTAFIPVPGTRIELVHPLRGEGPIATHLEKRGPGLHHLCFRTDDIAADVARLRERGWKFLTDDPTPGAHGTRVIFVHPRSTGGVLLELAEHPKESA